MVEGPAAVERFAVPRAFQAATQASDDLEHFLDPLGTFPGPIEKSREMVRTPLELPHPEFAAKSVFLDGGRNLSLAIGRTVTALPRDAGDVLARLGLLSFCETGHFRRSSCKEHRSKRLEWGRGWRSPPGSGRQQVALPRPRGGVSNGLLFFCHGLSSGTARPGLLQA
jgi:hypothetical protein